MLRVKGIVALVAVLAAVSSAGDVSIVASWRSPSVITFGIDYYGGYLYHATPTESRITVTTLTGSIITWLPDVTRGWDLDRTPVEFWVAVGSGRGIARLSTTGSFIRQVSTPGNLGLGITYGEGCLWYATLSTTPYLYRLTVNGSVMSSFQLPGRSPGGLFWEASTLWYADAANPSGSIYHLTTTGSVLDSITVPNTRPAGITWQGPYLWYTDYNNHYVYQARYSPVGVTPASLGRVKAMYR